MIFKPHRRSDEEIKARLQGEHNGTWICPYCKDVVELYNDVIGVEECMCRRYSRQYTLRERKQSRKDMVYPKVFLYKSQLKGGEMNDGADIESQEED
jgi:hypothetical protein